MKRNLIVLAGMFFATFVWRVELAAQKTDEIVVIVHKDNPLRALSQSELRPIFLTKKMSWPDGSLIVAYNLPEKDTVRQGFDAAVLGLDPERVSRYWVDRKIRGDERPPTRLGSPASVVRMVASNKGAIGYVNAADNNASVKIVARVVQGRVQAP